jgi:hypothetical protein
MTRAVRIGDQSDDHIDEQRKDHVGKGGALRQCGKGRERAEPVATPMFIPFICRTATTPDAGGEPECRRQRGCRRAAAIAWSVKLTGLSLDKIVNLLLADDWRQRLS